MKKYLLHHIRSEYPRGVYLIHIQRYSALTQNLRKKVEKNYDILFGRLVDIKKARPFR